MDQQETKKAIANIRVAVRCRPPLDSELKQGNTFEKLIVQSGAKGISAYNERTNSYKNASFDIVMDSQSSQGQCFQQAGLQELVKHVTDGYHATVFAYGQTGSGKTYTMEGYKYKQMHESKPPQAIFEQGENEGIVPRSIRLLFDLIKQQSNLQKKKFTVYCSYLQIYKEKIYDLLNKSHVKGVMVDGPGLKLKWNKNDIFTVENLYTFECKSVDDVIALYHFGIKNKVIASHNMNNSSSRSHSMLSLTVEQVDISNIDNVVVSKLQLVDLAGSERQSQTGNIASKESIDINKSLFTLRQVITSLTEHQNKGVNESNSYVPYRDSKLTCLLRQSLGGNSFCLMIACLNPCDSQIEENISTMQYASQASYISNKPVRNDDPKARMIEVLKGQVRRLTEELAKANDTIDFQNRLISEHQANLNNNFERNYQHDQTNKDSTGEADGYGRNQKVLSQNSRESQLVEHRQIITQRIVKDQEKVDKFFQEKADQLKSIASYQRQQNPLQPHSAANESKDAITERIVHTLNMMKQVLQGNLSLRATIQKQSEQIDDQNAEMFQLQQENEDLRERLNVLEEYTGKDSMAEVQKLVREKRQLENRVKHLEQTSNNWNAQKMQRLPSGRTENRRQQTITYDAGEFDDFEPVRPMINDQHDTQMIETENVYYHDLPQAQLSRKSGSMVKRDSNMRVGSQDPKQFRVTTQQKPRTMNILSKQRVGSQQPQFNSKSNSVKAPLPHITDRNMKLQKTEQRGKFMKESSKKYLGEAISENHYGQKLRSVLDTQTEYVGLKGTRNEHFVDGDSYQNALSYSQAPIISKTRSDVIRSSAQKIRQAASALDDDEPSRPSLGQFQIDIVSNENKIQSPSTHYEMVMTGQSGFSKLPPQTPDGGAGRHQLDHTQAETYQVNGIANINL